MPTRFYLPSDTANNPAAVDPPISSEWEHQNVTRRITQTTKRNSALTNLQYTPDASDHIADQDALFVQYVSDPLAAQTISSQTISTTIAGLEANTGSNLFLTWKVYAVSNDGQTVVGTILAIRRDNTEFTTSQLSRFDSATSTSVTVSDGDRLVFEIGMGGSPVAAGGVQGHNGTLRLGDPTATADHGALDNNSADTCPWIEFANVLSFSGGGAPTPSFVSWIAGDF